MKFKPGDIIKWTGYNGKASDIGRVATPEQLKAYILKADPIDDEYNNDKEVLALWKSDNTWAFVDIEHCTLITKERNLPSWF